MSEIQLMNNRREFLIAAGSLLTATAVAETKTDSKPKHTFCVFTKPFNSLSYDELADRIAELGFDGLEAPVRAGGNVEPEQVEDKLPELVEALRKRNLEVTVMTSDINDPNDPLSKRVIRTAATSLAPCAVAGIASSSIGPSCSKRSLCGEHWTCLKKSCG